LKPDASNRLIGVRGRNASITGKRIDGTGPTYSHTYGDVEETMTIPTSPNGRIQLTVHRTGVDGCEATINLICPVT
jgi:hypothetical protein